MGEPLNLHTGFTLCSPTMARTLLMQPATGRRLRALGKCGCKSDLSAAIPSSLPAQIAKSNTVLRNLRIYDGRSKSASAKAGVERMNRTIKGMTFKRYSYETHSQLRQHMTDFVGA